MAHTGGCQCGRVRFEMDVLEEAHVCHCRMCQKATGGLFAALVGAPKDKIRWTATPPEEFQSSNLARRAFCQACGTPLGFTYNLPNARQYVTIGSLDHPEDAPIIHQFGLESKVPFVTFCEDIPGECTGDTPAVSEFLADMTSNQA
ncbi:GFA family protein [Hyphomonas jannaschiana]|uniref:CENP-V/GFA domain-containing protein n=1 Tax=Hyphomonas jannaschiana VP2 TaxID=1280952 RepID=A0A059FL44_9PROT|nr:GFA family protein [Hyphomonas jannaschiana]KCZ91332.1 hypothetical protein HJA_02300 [Hyphomonas jannaschiana VP2]